MRVRDGRHEWRTSGEWSERTGAAWGAREKGTRKSSRAARTERTELGVNICFIAIAPHPTNGLILGSARERNGVLWRLVAGTHVRSLCSSAFPLRIGEPPNTYFRGSFRASVQRFSGRRRRFARLLPPTSEILGATLPKLCIAPRRVGYFATGPPPLRLPRRTGRAEGETRAPPRIASNRIGVSAGFFPRKATEQAARACCFTSISRH